MRLPGFPSPGNLTPNRSARANPLERLGSTSPELKRRHQAVQSYVDARRGQAPVRLALRCREDVSAGLELAAIDGRENNDRRVLGNEDLLFAALVLHGQDAVLARADDVGHVSVG